MEVTRLLTTTLPVVSRTMFNACNTGTPLPSNVPSVRAREAGDRGLAEHRAEQRHLQLN